MNTFLDSRAKDASLATGKVKYEVDPFQRRYSISRTQPRGWTISTPVCGDLSSKSSNRKREKNVSLGNPLKQSGQKYSAGEIKRNINLKIKPKFRN